MFSFVVRGAIFVSFGCNFHVPRSILYRRIRRLNPFRRWKACINYETCHEFSIFGNPGPLFSIILFLSLIPPRFLIVPSRSTISFMGGHKNCIKSARIAIDRSAGRREGIALDRRFASKYRNIAVCFTVCAFRENIGSFTNVLADTRENVIRDYVLATDRRSHVIQLFLLPVSPFLQPRHW